MTECQAPLGLDDVGMQVLPREAIVTQLAVFLDERTRPSLSLIQLKALQVPSLPPRLSKRWPSRPRASPRNMQSMRAISLVNCVQAVAK